MIVARSTLVRRYLAIALLGACVSLRPTSGGAQYPLLPVPPGYRGASGEAGQIRLDGIARKVTLFHGKSDDEADWHIYIDIGSQAARDISAFLRSRGTNVTASKLATVYSEVMVVDRHENNPLDERFVSGDVSLAFRLAKPGSNHPAWDLGRIATTYQGINHDFSKYSKLVQDVGRVYLQGAFVNDAEHGTLVEIHPLESIAFAMDDGERTISAKPGEAGWPARAVRWRVAFLGNSSFHRINGEPYMRRQRTVTWFLDLPSAAYTADAEARFQVEVVEQVRRLWNGHTGASYQQRGVRSVQSPLVTDPADGKRKLKVTAVMRVPDQWGGLVVRDYLVRVRPKTENVPIRK